MTINTELSDERLRESGVDDPAALRLDVAAAFPQPLAPEIAAAIAHAADPTLAVSSFRRLGDAAPALLVAAATEPAVVASLVALLGASPLVARLLVADPEHWRSVAANATTSTPSRHDTETAPLATTTAASFEELACALRSWKRRRILTIAARDLLGTATVEETTGALTALAEDTLDAAIAWIRRGLVAEYGELLEDARPAGFVALGMGKLGGGELNFSSDIDLVYLYERDGIETVGGPRGRVTAREFCTRLAEQTTRAMHQSTADGIVFRVDLRLRPEGTNGPIVNSAANALTYYEAWGQTWERAAYLKARPVAGDRAFGDAFLRELAPFIYRRYSDYETLEDIKHMKARVEAALAAARAKGTNVKLGRGGIREVEFIIQSLQLVHAGKDERIRERSSLRALAILAEHRYLDAAEGERLRDAYRFLRDVEHKIQLVDERQTQVIPSGVDELRLARRLGFGRDDPAAALPRFHELFARHADAVHASFTALFYSPREAMDRAGGDPAAGLLDLLADDARLDAGLAALGFRDPAGGRAHLRLLHDGSPTAPASPRRKKLLATIAPALLGEITRAPDPDLALRNMASFIVAVGARSSFLALLAENPRTLRVLVRLFGSSEFLSQILIRHPEMLDSLVRADLVRVEIPKDTMAAELASVLDAAEAFEEQLDALRRFRNEQFLRVGVNDLENLLSFPVVSSQLSDVADVCLDAAWRVARHETLRRYELGAPPGRFVVVGMGKLGSRELTYNSDLDLIFIYAASPDAGAARDGAPVSMHEYFTRVAQTMMTVLQAPTREGRVYKIDTRLRPSGTHGPLVSSLDAFVRYHAESSALWERQAMIKARAVVGDPALRADVEQVIARFVYARPLAADEAAEIHRIRMRMERELAGDESEEFNIKTGRGGIVDIEFLVQMLQLRYGAELPAVRERATRHALAALAASGVVSPDDARSLDESYAFLRALTNRLRIERDQPVEALERGGEGVAALARRLGYEGANEEVARRLIDDYARHRERVRALYERYFA